MESEQGLPSAVATEGTRGNGTVLIDCGSCCGLRNHWTGDGH